MPAPIAPWMSASEALTIWMLSTAMKAPSVAPITASQVLAETTGSVETGAILAPGIVSRVADIVVMTVSSSLAERMHWAAWFDNRENCERIIQQNLKMRAGFGL